MKKFVTSALIILGMVTFAFGQDARYTDNSRDQVLRGSGRVNASTLGMEFQLPLANYPGRGINVPVNLSYSSKVWRLQYIGTSPYQTSSQTCFTRLNPEYAEKSASGWTTSLAVPYIEYTGANNPYTQDGEVYDAAAIIACDPGNTDPPPPVRYIRRLTLHLPSGESHELRASDTPGGNGPWDGVFYAVDSSNIIYKQDSSSGLFRVLLPDGSFYDLNSGTGTADRYANKFTDRNGNFTTYHAPNATYPNGYWMDTLGKPIPVPFQPAPPGAPTSEGSPQIYLLPGMTESYKFHWKRLKGSSAGESGLSNFGESLRYLSNATTMTSVNWTYRDQGTFLFTSDHPGNLINGYSQLFNPVVLTRIELPTGQSYEFKYNVHGEIVKITYPTGGKEEFVYNEVGSVSEILFPYSQTNRGVTNRKVYETTTDSTPYEWDYETETTNGFVVRTTNPDGTKHERFLHRVGNDAFGFGNVLAGMPFKELTYSSDGALVAQKLTNWTKSGERHPRVDYEETIVYDAIGNGVSATTTFGYEGDLAQKETPVLVKKTTQYAFETVTGWGSLFDPPCNPDDEFCNPPPTPTPSPTPTSPPVKIVETTYLINDPNYVGVKSYYTAQNMIGLVTASQVKDGSGTTVVSRSETVYDESGRSPGYRGNPTTSKVWDSTKGLVTNTSAYISTSARFDGYGNQYEATDAKGNSTTTTFDSTHNAFPVSVTSAVPDPTGTHGSNTPFVTTATFNYETGLPLTNTDANGLRTEIEYDAATLRPRFTRTFFGSTQVGSTTETVYNDEPNNYWVKNRSQIDENKWAESITYFDGLGRAWKSEQVDSGGNIFVKKEFDADGRVSRVSNPYRLSGDPCYVSGAIVCWTTNVYDNASRVIEVELPDGAEIKTDYGVSVNAPVGVTKQITDQAGKKRKGITDALGRMIRVIEDPTGQNLNTDYVFDTLGNLRKTIQGEQNRYFYHDSLGRLRRAKQPEQDVNAALALPNPDPITGNNQWSVGYSHDDNGNIISTTDAKNTTVSATYDNFNRIILRNYSDLTMPDVSFFYDGKYLNASDVPQTATGSVKGKTTGIKSSVSRTNYTEFDELGRLKTHQQITDGQTYPTSYIYNLSGALIEETYPSGRVVKNTLDQDGALSQVQSKKNANYGFHTYAGSFTYDSSGAVTKMQLGNGRWETASYNNRLQITQIGLGATDNAQDLLKLEYSYATPSTTNNNGSLREQKITVPTVGGTSGFTATQTYAYDDLNRLQIAEEKVVNVTTWKQTFTIDRYGNRRFDTANTTTLGSCTEAVCNPTVSTSNNRISSSGYGFDANGNVTQDVNGRQFIYDAENHQTEVKDSESNVLGEYLYDGQGKRVKKISATETTIFVYNASRQLVAEYSTQISQTPQVSYLTQDHLGSPRVITDQSGAVTSRKDFTAFGEENYTAQRTESLGYSGNGETRKGYTGYEKDDESGLDFAQARYYNSTHGRYTSVDPLTASASIRNPQTFNRYSYVLNSPYKFTDPLGLLPLTSAGACGNFCPNSGPTIDGSAFRGRDASFDWAEPLGEPYAGGVQLAAGLSENEVKALVDAFTDVYATVGGYDFFNSFNDVEYDATLILDVGDLSSEDKNGKTTFGMTIASRDKDGHMTIKITLDINRIDKAVSDQRKEQSANRDRVFGQTIITGVVTRQEAGKHEVSHGIHASGNIDDYIKQAKAGTDEIERESIQKGERMNTKSNNSLFKKDKASVVFKRMIGFDKYKFVKK